MYSWRDLEREFTELHQALKLLGCRVDRTWRDGQPDQWRVTGGSGPLLTSRFESLATMAGRLLGDLDPALLPDAALAETDPFRRWLAVAWAAASPQTSLGFEKHSDGTDTTLYFGSIDHPAAVSSVLCLHYEAHTAPVSGKLALQLAAPRYASVLQHWQKASAFLSRRNLIFPTQPRRPFPP